MDNPDTGGGDVGSVRRSVAIDRLRQADDELLRWLGERLAAAEDRESAMARLVEWARGGDAGGRSGGVAGDMSIL